jgi:two-component system response regulator (stage 0 sporulation protein F)
MQKKNILIVDDEAGFLLALQKILRGREINIDSATTFETAMALLSEQIYDVVVTDVRLTMVLREEGFEILKYVKEHSPATKVIIITGYGNPDIVTQACNLGADLFFEKPFSSSILKNTLRCWGVKC